MGCFSSVNVKIHRLNILFSTVALVAHPFIFYNRLNLLDCLQQNPIRNTFLRLFCHVEFLHKYVCCKSHRIHGGTQNMKHECRFFSHAKDVLELELMKCNPRCNQLFKRDTFYKNYNYRIFIGDEQNVFSLLLF